MAGFAAGARDLKRRDLGVDMTLVQENPSSGAVGEGVAPVRAAVTAVAAVAVVAAGGRAG